jgi:hypothetical protein
VNKVVLGAAPASSSGSSGSAGHSGHHHHLSQHHINSNQGQQQQALTSSSLANHLNPGSPTNNSYGAPIPMMMGNNGSGKLVYQQHHQHHHQDPANSISPIHHSDLIKTEQHSVLNGKFPSSESNSSFGILYDLSLSWSVGNSPISSMFIKQKLEMIELGESIYG